LGVRNFGIGEFKEFWGQLGTKEGGGKNFLGRNYFIFKNGKEKPSFLGKELKVKKGG